MPRIRAARIVAVLAASLLAGCGGGGETPGASTSTTSEATTSSSPTTASTSTGGAGGASTTTTSANGGGGSGGSGCGRVPGPSDGPRKVVVSRPYDMTSNGMTRWEVLDLDPVGVLAQPGTTFEMGRAFTGEVVFTPDGEVGIAVLDDGSLGVFRFDQGGSPVVVHTSFQGSFYAGAVVIDPSGDGAFVLDPNWRNNGGGLYRIAIGCDGAITDLGLVAPAKLSYGMVRLGATPSRAVLASADVLASAQGDNAHLLDLAGPAPLLVSGAPAFPDDKSIISSVARTHDDRFVLIADNGEFTPPTRVAVVSVNGDAIAPVQILSPIEDPYALVTSPFDNAALVVSGYGNAIFALGYDPTNATTPFTQKGEIAYAGKAPSLPAKAVMITRGALNGHVLVSETSGVRQVRFEPDGQVTDIGAFSFGSGLANIAGAIGVTP